MVRAIDWNAVPLRDALAGLGSVSSLNFVMRATELEAAGIDLSAPITLHVKDMPLRAVLDTVATLVGSGTIKLGWWCEGDTVWFGSGGVLSSRTVLRIYDIGPLVVRIIADPSKYGNTFSQDVHGNGFLFQNGATDTWAEAIEIIETHIQIQTTIDEWTDNGGIVADMWVFDDRLLVKHTVDGHKKVAATLQLLEGKR